MKSTIISNILDSGAGIPDFLIYLVAAVVLLGISIYVYVLTTPYKEMTLIREGNTSASITFIGTLLGMTFPMMNAIIQSHNLVDMIVWGAIGCIVQLVAWFLVKLAIPSLAHDIPNDKRSSAVFLGGVSVCVGLINAACITY